MRTTVDLADDVVALVDQLCSETGVDISEAINELVRRGAGDSARRPLFVQRTSAGMVRTDAIDVEDAVDVAEGPDRR